MARYIDADAFIRILDAKADMAMGTPKAVFLSVAKMVDYLPHSDVAPKSEVERLEQEIETLKDNNEHLAVLLEEAKDEANRYKRYYFHHDYDKMIAEAKAEVAREIFEEIEKIIDKHHGECYEYEDGDECDTAITYISYISCDIDELKKKYTEEKE